MSRTIAVCAAIIVLLTAAPNDARVAQDVHPDRPVQTTLYSLVTSLPALAGERGRGINVAIGEVVTPRAFKLVSRENERFHPQIDERRALVLTRLAAPSVNAGTPVHVIGTAYTLAGARAHGAWPEVLSADLANEVDDWPIVLADAIVTAGGVPLYRERR